MQRYKKLLVVVNLDDEDVSLIQYASRITRMAGSEEVHFFHISPELDLPEPLCSAIEGDQSCQSIVERMKAIVQQYFTTQDNTRLGYDASDRDQLRDLLLTIKQKDVDLVVVDKKCGGARMSERVARKAPCSVALVPSGSPARFDNIFVALDFSPYSREALETALAFARAGAANRLTCVHVYTVPSGYNKTGRSYEQFASIMKQNAQQQFDELLPAMNTEGIEIEFISQASTQPFQGIAEIVHTNGADLLVVGSRGRSKTAAILLGSVTERLIEICNVPILTVKRKGQGLSFMEAILDL